MKTSAIAFQVTDWEQVPVTAHPGETGTVYWRSLQLGHVRVRLVEYSPGYAADHWC